MINYAVRRLLMAMPILLAITVLIFCIRALVPGDPVEIMFFGESPPQEVVERIRASWGLDRPIYEQYLIYIGRVVRGDFGLSYRSREPVAEEIFARFPRTLTLAVCGLTLGLAVGLLAGIVSAVKQNSAFDLGSMMVALAGVSMPSFWLGLLLIYFFSVRWRLLPPMGSGTWQHLVLPSVTLGLLTASVIARLTRSSMLEVLRQDYVRTARAKGLSERVVVYKHSLRNALIPVITVVGLQFGALLGGAFITETVFAYPGLGQLGVNAIRNRDFPIIQGVLLTVCTFYVSINLLVDLVYGFINPRISYR